MFERSLSSCDISTMEGNAASAPARPQLHKSVSVGNCLVEKKRGFMPSDRHDPKKRQFLIELSQQFWQRKANEPLNSKRIDLQKIFTPATDAEEILPKNRKLYASSAFYSPTLHPTVEDQVELARRISHSLSDISNHQSKGQSMYVNRKKRSVKWVHEGSGKETQQQQQQQQNEHVHIQEQEQQQQQISHQYVATTMDAATTHVYDMEGESKENTERTYNNNNNNINMTTTATTTTTQPLAKVPLKLVMNPRGQVRDLNSMREALNTETGLLSPDRCAELVSALNMQKGKGAELFAKRRKKAEKWVVDETNAATQSPSGLADNQQQQQQQQYQAKSPTSPSLLPAYSDAGKHRVQLNMQQEQLLEKYARPGLKVVKTPWAAALETGNASSAFVEEQRGSPHYQQLTPSMSPAPPLQYVDNRAMSPFIVGGGDDLSSHKLPSSIYHQGSGKLPGTAAYNAQRDLAYRPSIAQGWKAPSVSLPRDLYIPKEIPLESYAPPPAAVLAPPTKAGAYITAPFNVDAPPYAINGSHLSPSPSKPLARFPVGRGGGSGGSGGGGGFCAVSPTPPRQMYLPPDSYQKVAPVRNATPQLGFNPSPLPYDKLAKFENVSPPEHGSPVVAYSPPYRGQPGAGVGVSVGVGRVRNISPAPYGARPTSAGSQTFPILAATPSGGTPTSSRPPSQQYGGYDARLSGVDFAAHGNNFNSVPRGWNGGAHAPAAFPASCGAGYRNAKPIAAMAMAALPYTDF